MEKKDTKPCPVCGEEIKSVAIKCRFCGENIELFLKKREAVVEKDIFSAHMPMIYSVGQVFLLVIAFLLLILPGLILLFVYWLESISTRYRITSQRVVVEKGIFSKKNENIELFRLDDFGTHRPFLMRLMGFGYLYLRSSDRSLSTVRIITKESDKLAANLREAAFAERERRDVKTWANA